MEFALATDQHEEALLIMEWRNDKETKKNSFNSSSYTLETFLPEYRKRYLADPSLPPLFGVVKGEKVGLVRFEKVPHPLFPEFKPCLEISILIAPNYRRKGLAKKLLKKGIAWARKFRHEDLLANILPHNEISIRLFETAGFTSLGKGLKKIPEKEKAFSVLRYLYPRKLKPPLKALFIDFDGTLSDNQTALFLSYQQFLQTFEKKGNAKEFHMLNGLNIKAIAAQLKATHNLLEGVTDLAALYRKTVEETYLDKAELFPKAEETLSLAKKMGLSLFIVTSSPKPLVEQCLRKFKLSSVFDGIFSGATLPKSKPDPALYLRALNQTGLTPDEVLVIEDSQIGLRAAWGAKIEAFYFREKWDDVYSFLMTEKFLHQKESLFIPADASSVPFKLHTKLPPPKQLVKAKKDASPLAFFSRWSREQVVAYALPYTFYLDQMAEPDLKKLMGLKPLGVAGITLCDGKILLGKRASWVSTYPNCFECAPSGGVDGKDLQKILLGELEEETGLSPMLVKHLSLIGMTFDSKSLNIDFVYLISLKKKALKSIIQTEEYSELFFIEKEKAADFLKTKKCVPSSQAILSFIAKQSAGL